MKDDEFISLLVWQVINKPELFKGNGLSPLEIAKLTGGNAVRVGHIIERVIEELTATGVTAEYVVQKPKVLRVL